MTLSPSVAPNPTADLGSFLAITQELDKSSRQYAEGGSQGEGFWILVGFGGGK